MAKQKSVAPVVKLKTATKDGKGKTRSFPEQTALKLLILSNSKWKLDDSGYKFNGKELSKNNN